jgi:hypothetical protein
MSDAKAKSRTWLWSVAIAVFVFVLYPLSAIPAALICDRLVVSGIVSRGLVERVVGGVYAPILRIPATRDALKSAIKKADKLLPGRRR